MRLNDYKISSEYDRNKWLDSYKIMSGLPYFGGKAFIGKYLINRICNMAVQMEVDGKKADIFVDVFGGGGKIALSVPEGWFDTIVLNDYNYGITSYFNCCKECPDELIALIEKLGAVMDKDLFHILAFIRSNDGSGNLEEKYKKVIIKDTDVKDKNEKEERETRYLRYKDLLFDDRIEPLLSAAATFWVTKLDFMGITEPLRVTYNASIKDNKSGSIGRQSEKEKIENAIKFAKKHIPEICYRMRKNNIIVERLDFAELIKKYNGKSYKTVDDKEMLPEDYCDKNKLWYLDSPYHPSTLNNGEEAPYEDTFDIELVSKMTEIIHNDKSAEYGEIDYFIKSDYDPKETFAFAIAMTGRYSLEKEKLENEGVTVNDKTKDTETGKEKLTAKAERLKTINDYLSTLEKQKDIIATPVSFLGKQIIPFHHFDCLEDNSEYTIGGAKPLEERVYFKECLGEFAKATTNKITGEKVMGKEYIWHKGMKPETADYLKELVYKPDMKVKNVLNDLVKKTAKTSENS